MRLEIDVMLDYQIREPSDVLLQIEAAAMADQRLIGDRLNVTSAEPLRAVPGYEGIGQRTWALGEGPFHAQYSAIVEIDRAAADLATLAAAPPRDLPGLVVAYLMPSRYVESDRFEAYVGRRFGALDGGAKVLAMRDWIQSEVDYASGTSSGESTAATTFVQRQGVCRDFAHLLTAFARAAGIPARTVSAYAPGVVPQDFHAVTEVWLAGGWHLVDATGMANATDIVRASVGRDATDIAFMTIFGTAELRAQTMSVKRTD